MRLFPSFEKAAREDPNRVRKGFTLVQRAAADGRADRLKLLVELDADVNAMGGNSRSAMYLAAARDDADTRRACLKTLLDAGADPDLPDSDGETPVYAVYRKKDRASFELLLEKGADPVAGPDNYKVLSRVIRDCNTEYFEIAMTHWLSKHPEHAQDVLAMIEESGVTAVTRTRFRDILSQHTDVEAIADPSDPAGLSALARRVADGDRVAVKVHLDENGYDAATDAEGRTPLHIAAQSGDHRMILMLLDAGADANAKDEVGFTPLDTLAEHGHLDSHAERFLTEAGGAFNRLPPKDDVTAKKKAHVKISQPGTGT